LHKFEQFFGGVGWERGVTDSAVRMSLKVHRISSEHITKMRLSAADCICISGFWGLAPDFHRGSAHGTNGGLPSQTPCAHPTSKPWLRRCQGSEETTCDRVLLCVTAHSLNRKEHAFKIEIADFVRNQPKSVVVARVTVEKLPHAWKRLGKTEICV